MQHTVIVHTRSPAVHSFGSDSMTITVLHLCLTLLVSGDNKRACNLKFNTPKASKQAQVDFIHMSLQLLLLKKACATALPT